mgnify:FL=1
MRIRAGKENDMSKKRKHPVKKMTEKDYENYVMSLKDEKPIKAITPEKTPNEG